VAGFAIGLTWGIVGVAAAYLGVTVLLAYPGFAIPFRFVGLRVRDLIETIRRPLILSCVMFGLVVGVSFLLPRDMTDIIRLTILVATGVAVYALGTWRFDRERVRQILKTTRASA
jgi:drug/metabolite transporter (DMT)-like permease